MKRVRIGKNVITPIDFVTRITKNELAKPITPNKARNNINCSVVTFQYEERIN